MHLRRNSAFCSGTNATGSPPTNRQRTKTPVNLKLIISTTTQGSLLRSKSSSTLWENLSLKPIWTGDCSKACSRGKRHLRSKSSSARQVYWVRSVSHLTKRSLRCARMKQSLSTSMTFWADKNRIKSHSLYQLTDSMPSSRTRSSRARASLMWEGRLPRMWRTQIKRTKWRGPKQEWWKSKRRQTFRVAPMTLSSICERFNLT